MTQEDDDEDRRRLVFSSLRLASRLAFRGRNSLGLIRRMAELAYFQQALRSGKKKGELGVILDVEATKVAELTRELREQFLEAEREHGLPRQLLSLLWASPQTLAQIHKSLPGFSRAEVDAALGALLEQERVREVPGRTPRYAPTGVMQRLTIVPWMAKLDGLNTLMDHVYAAVLARMERSDPRAMVRNIAFQVSPEDTERLGAFYESVLIPFLAELDANAQKEEAPVQMKFSILWAPDPEAE